MSVERRPDGTWRVRWREGGRNRAHTIGSYKGARRDAEAFDLEKKREARLGILAKSPSKQSLSAFVQKAFYPRHVAKKAPKTQELYAYLFDCHIEPYLGYKRLTHITVADVDEWLGELERRKVGRVAQQKALTLCSLIFNKAVRWEAVDRNPAYGAERPKHTRKPVIPPTPLEVERVREKLNQQRRFGDAVLVSVMAYAGLRPQEATGLRWPDVRDRTLLVAAPKTNTNRAVRILAPLAHDLAEWKLATRSKSEWVFPNANGRQWTEAGWSSWRRRVWVPIVSARFTPYALRHTFVSLLIREGRLSVVEIAQQAGHSPQTCLRTYAHEFSELSGRGKAEDAIRAARAEVAHEVQEAEREFHEAVIYGR